MTKISLKTDTIPHLTNVISSKGRFQATGITVVLENEADDLKTRLHGMLMILSAACIVIIMLNLLDLILFQGFANKLLISAIIYSGFLTSKI